MAKVGDKVRFLNATGGGVITRIQDKTAYVEDEDGFESPFLMKDLVVVLPAGHEALVKGSSIMFDQKAFDKGRENTSQKVRNNSDISLNKPDIIPTSEKPQKIEETEYGDNPSVSLVFEPQDIKRLGNTRYIAVLVNDSNYFLDFSFLRRSSTDRGWEIIYNGSVNPNELIDLAVLGHEELPNFEKVALQAIAYKKERIFSLIPPLNVTRKLDLTKFHKLHCFRQSKYFDSPVLEYPLINSGETVSQHILDNEAIENSLKGANLSKDLAKELSKKYKTGKTGKKIVDDSQNPFKRLPLIEVDLHIGELTDTTVGMESKDMLEVQLSEVRKTMAAHSRRQGQKIVFIHGKGEGVLRKAVLDLLKKEYPKAKLQDASFREYGFGATLVTI